MKIAPVSQEMILNFWASTCSDCRGTTNGELVDLWGRSALVTGAAVSVTDLA